MYWNNVETKPGAGYPRDWEELGGGWDEEGSPERPANSRRRRTTVVRGTSTTRRSCTRGATSRSAPWRTPTGGRTGTRTRVPASTPTPTTSTSPDLQPLYAPPASRRARARRSTSAREDGIVLVDQDRCRGYRYCVEGCPYKKVFYNAQTKTSEKCIFCYPPIEGEGPGEVRPPSCAEDCPPQLRHVGFLDDEDGPIHKLVNEYEVALRLHPEYRTEPNVYYIPPYAPPQTSESGETVDANRIPRNYLEELFGPEVESALNTITREREKAERGEERETHGDPLDREQRRPVPVGGVRR